ncbi:MAG: acetyl-CoA carboxylase, carboxyltransferase subunit beta [Puniceicoccales bacterium]|jgi:acetyl-CoA carboxylase carboxyl transferase subunit beta|nr:acetyl-CoA carboxylase, carboxyltransferase subunit beta [Puniceicoccales bacterium]
MALFSKPKYSTISAKRKDIPKGVWTKCPISGETVYNRDLEKNFMVVPKSGYHFPLQADKRIELLCDDGTFREMWDDLETVDPLGFGGEVSYLEKLAKNREKTGMREAVISGCAELNGIPIAISVMDFRFLGASMGSVVGEKITRTIELGVEKNFPVILVCASGGARMYEGILSLMQMAKTSAALAKLREANGLYVSVLTNPTMAGVMASFASLGDIIIAEPGALIGFAGPRVIKETVHQDLPKGFQTAEFLLEHGLIDQIVNRLELKCRLGNFLKFFGYHPGRPNEKRSRRWKFGIR